MKTFKQFTEELSLFEQPTKKKPGVYGQAGGLEIGTNPGKEQDVGYRIGRGLTGALKDLGPGLLGQLQGKDNAALQRQRARAQALTRLITTGQISNNGASTPAAPAASTPTKPQRGQGGRELGSTTQRQGGAISPTTQSDTTRSTAPAPAPRTAAKPFVKQTGDKAKDQATWAKANPTAVASEKKRKASRNPLMDRTFGYQTGQGGSTLNKASDLAALQAKAKADTISRSPNAARINRRLGL